MKTLFKKEVFQHIDEKSDLTPEAQTVLGHEKVDFGHLKDRLEGRSGGLRTSKPTTKNDTGLEQYVWRMARFHAGHDTSMPVTATWDLSGWLESQDIDAKVTGIKDGKSGDEILGILDVMARLVANDLTGSAERGLDRWQKAIYG